MIFVFGGSYQGKTDFVKKTFSLTDEDIFVPEEGMTEFETDRKAISHMERFIYSRIEKELPVFDWFDEHMEMFRDRIVICDDISCGVVPIEKILRLYRDNVGKQMQIFSREADEVYRVYAGLGEKLK